MRSLSSLHYVSELQGRPGCCCKSSALACEGHHQPASRHHQLFRVRHHLRNAALVLVSPSFLRREASSIVFILSTVGFTRAFGPISAAARYATKPTPRQDHPTLQVAGNNQLHLAAQPSHPAAYHPSLDTCRTDRLASLPSIPYHQSSHHDQPSVNISRPDESRTLSQHFCPLLNLFMS